MATNSLPKFEHDRMFQAPGWQWHCWELHKKIRMKTQNNTVPLSSMSQFRKWQSVGRFEMLKFLAITMVIGIDWDLIWKIFLKAWSTFHFVLLKNLLKRWVPFDLFINVTLWWSGCGKKLKNRSIQWCLHAIWEFVIRQKNCWVEGALAVYAIQPIKAPQIPHKKFWSSWQFHGIHSQFANSQWLQYLLWSRLQGWPGSSGIPHTPERHMPRSLHLCQPLLCHRKAGGLSSITKTLLHWDSNKQPSRFSPCPAGTLLRCQKSK